MFRFTQKSFIAVVGLLFLFFLMLVIQDPGEETWHQMTVGIVTVAPEFLAEIDNEDQIDEYFKHNKIDPSSEFTATSLEDLHDDNVANTVGTSSVHEATGFSKFTATYNLEDLHVSGIDTNNNVTNTVKNSTVELDGMANTAPKEAEIVGWEYNASRNLHDYLFKDKMTATILPENFCQTPSLLVIMVTTAPNKLNARMAIRTTWGKEKKVLGYNVSIYYLIGQTSDKSLQDQVNYEAETFQDIIQEDFKDTYNNLTLKSVALLKLFNLACSATAQYVLKIDDDMFLSVSKLVAELAQRNDSSNLIMGGAICGAAPIRYSNNKWYAPRYLFDKDKYPRYVSGTGYLMSSDAVQKILDAAFTTPIFHLEDVYLTGICSKKAGIVLTHNPRFTYRWLDQDLCLLTQLITVHYQSPDGIRKIYYASTDSEFAERCAESKSAFKVQKWMMDNVFVANTSHKRRDCS